MRSGPKSGDCQVEWSHKNYETNPNQTGPLYVWADSTEKKVTEGYVLENILVNVASPFKALTPKGELLEIKEGKLMIELLSLSEGNIKNPPRWQPKDRGKRHVVMVVPDNKEMEICNSQQKCAALETTPILKEDIPHTAAALL